MTMPRGTSILFSFRSKIEEAVSLVPRMCAEEKLKAVQFWNIVSEKLQDIVNSSAADINAVALKMGETEAEKLTLEMSNSTNYMTSQTNAAPTDFMNLPSGYPINNESGSQFLSEELHNTQLKQTVPNDAIFSSSEVQHQVLKDGHAVTDIPHIHHLNSVIDTPKDDNEAICNQLLGLAHIPPSNCDTFDLPAPEKSAQLIPDTLVGDTKSNDFLLNDELSGTLERVSMHYTPHPCKTRTDLEGSSSSTSVASYNMHVRRSHKILKKNSVKLKNAAFLSKRDLKSKNLSDGSNHSYTENSSDYEPVNHSDDSIEPSDEHIVGFVVSKSEEIMENSEGSSMNRGDVYNNDDKSPYTCNLCNQSFPDDESLSSHRTSHDKPYTCSECNSVFSNKGNLVVHMRRHTGEKPYCCNKCSSRFSTRGNLKRHVKTHSGEKPWKCNLCNNCFTEKKSLTIHMRRHTGERPYKCKECGKGFAQTGILQAHMAMHLDIKVHLCELCGKSFRQKSQLRIHKLRHDNVRKYGCASCASFFLTKADLERHSRKHTGEKPFACDVCQKTFTRQQSLNEHLNRHYGIRPYSCKYCGKTFVEMSACYKHIKQHAKNSIEISKNIKKVKANPENEAMPNPVDQPVAEAGNTENELPNLEDGTQYIAVVLNSKGACETNENNQTILFNSVNEENIVANGFGVLTAINLLTNATPIPQVF